MTIPFLLIEIPIENSLVTNPVITILFVTSFIMSATAIAFGKRILVQNTRNFFQTRERNSIFDTSTNIEWWVNIILMTQLCIMFAINMTAYINYIPSNIWALTKLILFYFLCAVAYISIKFLLYEFQGWMFFDNIKKRMWTDSYKTILICNSFVFFIMALMSVYLHLSYQILQISFIIILIINKILILYKWIQLFLNQKVGYVLFILQFCALEIVPCFIAYKGVIEINTLLI